MGPGSAAGWAGALALAGCVATAGAIALDVDPVRIESALKIARGTEAERVAFHRPYIFVTAAGALDMIEAVTEVRRLVQIAEARIAVGDQTFASGTLSAQEALRPWRRRLAIVARLRFPPQNAYVMAPPVDVTLHRAAGEVPRLDLRSESRFALGTGAPNERLPVVGGVTEAIFDAALVGQGSATVVVRLEGRELGRTTIDFGRLD
jgi:hypothetical protein